MPTLDQELDLNLGLTRGATYFAAARDLIQGTKLAATSTKAIPVVNGLLNLVEAGRLAYSPDLREQRKQSLETNALKNPLRSAGLGVINPVGTLYGFGSLLNDMFNSNSDARRSEMAYQQMLLNKQARP